MDKQFVGATGDLASGREFYLDVDKSKSNWQYSLRLRTYDEERVGVQIATFNPYACLRHPGLMETIVDVLNRALREETA
jgi:hypothetical protein